MIEKVALQKKTQKILDKIKEASGDPEVNCRIIKAKLGYRIKENPNLSSSFLFSQRFPGVYN